MLRSCLALALLVAGAAAIRAEDGYRVGPRDVLAIRVAELDELSKTFEVAEDGSLDLPILGRLVAQGRTAEQLAADLESELVARGVRRATVTVRVAEFRVSVLGAVARPGVVTLPSGTTLLEVMVAAGGVTTENAGRVMVRRKARNGLTGQVAIAVEDLLERGDPHVNLPILAGDLIQVPPAEVISVHVLGEVERPGSLTFKSTEPATVLAALARAGGLTETASRTLRIQRQGAEELSVNVRRVLAGKDDNPALVDGDILIVKESFF